MMTLDEAISIIKSTSCYDCSIGCNNTFDCNCECCELKEANKQIVDRLQELKELKCIK